MLTTSSEYKTAIKAAQRDIKASVYIYFDGESETPTFLGSDNINGIEFLEETQAEGGNPLGSVSSNEIRLLLKNDEQQFVPANASSDYYGKLVPGLKVVPSLDVKINGTYESIELGTYWTGDWDAPSDSIAASVVCHDRLYELGEEDMPLIPTAQNVTIYAAWYNLFNAIGLASDNYVIDASLTTVVPIMYYPNGKVRSVLSALAEGFNCNVSVNRSNQISVVNNSTVGSSVVTFSDDNMLYNADMPQEFENVYSDLKVIYKQPYLGASRTVLLLNNIAIADASSNTLEKLQFNSPVGFVDYIRVTGAHLTIGDMSIGTWGITLTITNTSGASQNVSIEVVGHPIDGTEEELTVRNTATYALLYDKDKVLTIKNYLAQSYSQALTYANNVLPIVSDPSGYISCSTRGDPSLELNDTITIDSDISKIGTIEIIPIRYQYRYIGGLRCEILGIKKSAREGT